MHITSQKLASRSIPQTVALRMADRERDSTIEAQLVVEVSP